MRQYIKARLLTAIALLSMISAHADAQTITQVSGTVSDAMDVLMGAAVCEIDANNRIIEATTTDINGNFSMKIKNPKDKIRFSYVGCQTQILPINRAVYKIVLKDKTTIKEVTITSKRRMQTSGLAIPEKEVSFSAQTISTKEFEGLGMNTIDEALQGRIAGLDIVANSGNLGSGTTMRLRGTSTISSATSAEPLIVVNGNVRNVDQTDFDLNSANEEKFAELLNVNPEDIEKISVLKDAAATAIWGSQGANGVIEITTKRGKRGKPELTYSLRLTGTYQPKGYDLLSGDDYTMMLKESYFNPKQDDNASNIREINYDPTFSEYHNYNDNTDWVDAVTQVGLRQNHYLSVTGGGEKATFRIAGGYDHETGSIIKQVLDRFSTRVALDYYVSDRILIQTNFSMTYTKNKKNYDAMPWNGYQSLLTNAYVKMPNMSIYEEDRNGNDTKQYYQMLQTGDTKFNDDQKIYPNPVALANLAKNDVTTYDINPEFILSYDLLGLDYDSWRLKYTGRVNMNISNNYEDVFYPQELTTVAWTEGVNSAYTGSSKSVGFTTRHQLVLQPYFGNEDHSAQVLARMELTSGNSTFQGTNADRLPSGGLTSPNAGGQITGMSSSYNRWRSLFYTVSTHYAFKERYSFDFTMRIDGTTKFGPGRRWGYFPSVSARWNISEEPFMKWSRKWLSMLSIRPSWGMVGNQPRKDYLYESIYAQGGRYLDMGSMYPTNIRLTDLKWETKKTWDIGMDLGFLDDRLNIVLEWYRSTTKDMLMENVGAPTSTGYNGLAYKNVGSMLNTGWEFNVTTNKILKFGKFTVDFNASFGNNRNEILTMDETVLSGLNTKFDGNNRQVLQRVQVHNPFGAIYGFKYKGVYQYNYSTIKNMESADEQQAFLNSGKTAPVALNADGRIIYDDEGKPLIMRYMYGPESSIEYEFHGGDAIYEDVNHDGNINSLDIVYLGSSLPKLTGGFGITLNYGQWRLNTQFNYRYGNKILNLARLDAEAMSNNNNQSQAVNYRWRKEGDVTSIPRAMYGSGTNYNTLISDRFVEDGSFLRMNYIQLTYAFKKALLKKIGLNRLSCYLSAQNLFLITKYKGVDPEVAYGGYGAAVDGGQTPRAKSFTFGVTVGI